MEPDQQQLRNLRDFLLVYNRMTEICFQKCTSNFNYRNLTMDEERCVDNCAGKLIRSNHRLMGSYVQLMPKMMQRRMDEMETKAAEAAAAATAAAPTALVEPPTTEASEASQTPIVTSSPAQPITPSLTDVGPVDYGSVFKPAGLDHGPGLDGPVGLNAAVSASTMATDLKLSAAIPLTPVTEEVVPPVLKDAKNEPSYTGAFSLPPLAGGQIEAGTLGLSQPPKAAAQIEAVSSAQPVFTPSEPTSLPVTVPVSTLAAPTASISTGTLSGQQGAPEAPPPPGQ